MYNTQNCFHDYNICLYTYHYVSFLGKCELSEHNSCFPDVCAQTWTIASLPHGKLLFIIYISFIYVEPV